MSVTCSRKAALTILASEVGGRAFTREARGAVMDQTRLALFPGSGSSAIGPVGRKR